VDDGAMAAVRAAVRLAVPRAQQPPPDHKWPSTRALLEGLLAAADATEVTRHRAASALLAGPLRLRRVSLVR